MTRGSQPAAQPTAANDVERSSAATLPTAWRVVGLVLYGVLGALTAAFEVVLVPTRVGATLFPIAVVLAIATNIVLPWLATTFTESSGGAVVPVLSWIVVLFVLSSSRPEGDVLLPGGGAVQYVSYGVMLGGLLTGLVTVGVLVSGGYSADRAGGRR